MVLKKKKITYIVDDKKYKIEVGICDTIGKKFMGLMFKKKSPALLFIFDKEKKLEIHSFFCKPFRAIWLDNKMKSTRVVDVKYWMPNISGKGKYLLEIPLSLLNDKLSTTNRINRNI